jgi:FtsZ-binding cell division protein ZapB
MSRKGAPMKPSELLADCNAKLSAQVQVQRNEINDLEDKLKELHGEREEWQETLLCVHRMWDELNTSIAFLDYL